MSSRLAPHCHGITLSNKGATWLDSRDRKGGSDQYVTVMPPSNGLFSPTRTECLRPEMDSYTEDWAGPSGARVPLTNHV
ncbi:MAG: hypothetical protein HOH43_09150 [Candidatus Latescibacteria bacterium]|jgi:hypothetical protein|nr:hypothetical protein [Candidatus Latescibacterota bacterium]